MTGLLPSVPQKADASTSSASRNATAVPACVDATGCAAATEVTWHDTDVLAWDETREEHTLGRAEQRMA